MAKRATSALKWPRAGLAQVKTERTDDFVVIGFTRSDKSGRAGVRGFHLAEADGEGGLTYVGRVGSGLTEKEIEPLRRHLESRGIASSVARATPRATALDVYAQPDVVVEIRFLARTKTGLSVIRSFLRVRTDNVSPTSSGQGDGSSTAAMARARGNKRMWSVREPTRRRVLSGPSLYRCLTNTHKIFWPEDGYTPRRPHRVHRAVSHGFVAVPS